MRAQHANYLVRVYSLRRILKVTPLFYSIGNAAEEILWAQTRAILEKKSLLVIKPYKITEILGYKICNHELFDLSFKCELANRLAVLDVIQRLYENGKFITRRIIHLVVKKFNKRGLAESWHFPQTGKNIIWPVQNSLQYSVKIYEKDPILENIHQYKYLPELKISKIEYCQSKLYEFGVEPNIKYICLHVRDEGFHGDGVRRGYRNADIENYYLGIEYLLNSGFLVMRMGDNKMRPMKIKHKNLIDYPFTNLKSEVMDLYLIKNCTFYIGMQSGILDVAQLFSKPILMLNMYSWFFAYPFKKCDRGLMKDITFEGQNKLLELSERFMLPYKYTNEREILGSEIKFIENTPTQILNAIKQFHFEYANNFTVQPSDEMELNKNLFLKASREIMYKPTDEFLTMPPSHLARITLRNLSSLGYLYTH